MSAIQEAAIGEVWKFRMEHLTEVFDVPKGATVVHVHEQDGIPCIWMIVAPTAKKERRTFQAIGTGQRFSGRYWYHGTAHCGSLVWHVFEVPK